MPSAPPRPLLLILSCYWCMCSKKCIYAFYNFFSVWNRHLFVKTHTDIFTTTGAYKVFSSNALGSASAIIVVTVLFFRYFVLHGWYNYKYNKLCNKTMSSIEIRPLVAADSWMTSSKMAIALTAPPDPPLVLIAPRNIVVPLGGILSRLAAYSKTGILLPSKRTWTGLWRLVETSIEGVSTPRTLAWRSTINEISWSIGSWWVSLVSRMTSSVDEDRSESGSRS